MSDDLHEFGQALRQDVVSEAGLEGAESTTVAALTRRFIQDLTEVAEIDDGDVAYHRDRGIEVGGYSVSDDETRLDLFLTIWATTPGETVIRTDIDTRFKRLTTFLERARGNLFKELEESTPEWDMAYTIHRLEDLQRVRLYVFTDGLARNNDWTPTVIDGLPVTLHVWDLQRLHRALTSGQQQEPIEIDFVESFGAPIPCLAAGAEAADYAAYLAIFPGDVLSAIYEQYGNRLLERNVRAFLQTRGKVNKGIQETIVKEPERFLAYNNGISATASSVELVPRPNGGTGIKRVRDFQIVNGGQTTASIHHARVKAKLDVSTIHVQAKLTVVQPEELSAIVPLISRYANSQNKVNEADFEANDPFHVAIEKQSRTVWAPASEGTQQLSRWFYERARGQYQDELSKQTTPARKRQFKTQHPPQQRFTKTDLAKFENTWDQFPHVVSLGAEKSFRAFTARMHNRGRVDVTKSFFEELIAKAIIFRRAEKAITQMDFGGYRANIVTYTLAHLSHRTLQTIDLRSVWLNQDISPALYETIQQVSRPVRDALLNAPGSGNITEWCKKPACWDRVRELNIPLSATMRQELVLNREPERYLLAEQIEELLRRSGDWLGKSAIAEQIYIPDGEWTPTIRRLMEQGRVERRGDKRGAEYRVTPM